ncbi:long-chain-fatty-acid--CoA ligase [Clostridium homopropionicum DSM 5847]|uniref:Long-chain-fatty-acid--CoA ligase n=1 Tax=Clostridium homopropionicum DSM 5847 TaxID=1121318 RepID=A0A0L6ZBL9_9CLOT|nr:AMP-binding protein [Clostridium homopropionicum]KOA20365.1 long-chain-fatty-acid--CoA ligase [Clostridium homopropionicum DSM 5847]SFG74232.1 Acyl-CoA synthetase (AMP-forming)/AMP-acid ligase II [Clostridium homopropionicum]
MTFTDYLFEFSRQLEDSAVIFKGEYSYKEIYENVVSIACFLQQKGLSKKDAVLLVSENSIFFINSYFGIIKSGAICVPINPSLSEEQIQYILKVLNIKLVFCEKKFTKKIKSLITKDVEIYTEDDKEYNSQSDVNIYQNDKLNYVNIKEDVAVILFTSGSTATPKGVMLTHYNLMYNTNSIIEYLNLTKNDRVEVVLPFYYCYGTSLLHTHFRVGGSLVINNRFMFPQTVIDDINKYNCTGFAGVPSTYQILLRMTDIKNSKLRSLRYITQAGGKLAEVFIKELVSILEGVDIFIMYGQTEATARLSYLPPNLINIKANSIGKGIPGTELKVINKNGEEVKKDEIGEVVARGGNIMKGYFNDEEETRKVIKNGYLYTGDLAKVDEEGYIYIVSREKNIIKSGGNRVSPKEIEDIIVKIPEVVECAVIGVEDDILGEAVKAFVVLTEENSLIDSKYIIDFSSKHLPSYKTPKYVEFLKKLPKNSSGKILIKKLKDFEEGKKEN